MIRVNLAVMLAICASLESPAQAHEVPALTLFTNVDVFDGVTNGLTDNANVLVEGNMTKTISKEAISANGATIIDGGSCVGPAGRGAFVAGLHDSARSEGLFKILNRCGK